MVSGRAGVSSEVYARRASQFDDFLNTMASDEIFDVYGDFEAGGDIYFGGDMSFGDAAADTLTVNGTASFLAEVSCTRATVDTTGGLYESGFKSRITATAGDGTGAIRGASCRGTAASGADDGELYGGEFYATQEDGSAISANIYGCLGYTKLQETDLADLPTGYVQGVLGIYECTGTDPSSAVIKGAVTACVKWDANAIPDGAFVAFRDGGGAGSGQGAAYKVKQLSTDTIPAFDYGLDLYTENASGGYDTADIRLQNEETIDNATDGYVNFSGGVRITGTGGAGAANTVTFQYATTAAGANTATFTNAPVAGNPTAYLDVYIGTTKYLIPCLASA